MVGSAWYVFILEAPLVPWAWVCCGVAEQRKVLSRKKGGVCGWLSDDGWWNSTEHLDNTNKYTSGP